MLRMMLDVPQRMKQSVAPSEPVGLGHIRVQARRHAGLRRRTSDEWVDAASVFAYTSYLLLTQLMITRYRPELEQAFDQELKPIASATWGQLDERTFGVRVIRRTATHCARAEAS